MADIQTITKRDGKVVPFDKSRIQNAIQKAFNATKEEHTDATVPNLVERVVYRLGLCADVTVEECQNIVEEELMNAGRKKTAKAYILYREDRARIRGTQIDEEWKTQANNAVNYFPSVYNYIVYLRTYSKWLENKGRRETWPETVTRFMDFMKSVVKDMLSSHEYDEIEQAILHMEVMPSMRMLQFAGEAVKRNNVCAYNCSYVAPTRLSDFHDTMMVLMCGTGAGFSVENKYVSQLPTIQEQTGEVLPTHVVGDSREGWCSAFLLGLETWYAGKDITFDYSQVRKAGARLKISGGRASGPGPLKELLDFARSLILDKQGGKLTSINVHDLMCKIGNIVVVGGVRRCLAKGSKVSSRRCLVSIEDVKVGMEVVTEKGFEKVTAVFDQGEQEVICIYHDEGFVKCTPNHRIAIGSIDDYEWIEAGNLKVGDRLIRMDRYDSLGPVILNQAKILTIQKAGMAHTYDIEVENDHCFFCDDILVHNSSLISISDLSDEAMRNAKIGQFWIKHGDRFMANNSAAYNEKPTDTELLTEWLSLVISETGERGIFNRSNLFSQLPERRIKLLGELIKDMGTNPCVTGDTKILTVDGEIAAKDLVGKKVDLIVDGERKKMLSDGFYPTGTKDTIELVTEDGDTIEATLNHPFWVIDRDGNREKVMLGLIDSDYIIDMNFCMNDGRVAKVKKFSYRYSKDVYDVTVEGHTFVANGFLTGNCGEILLLPREFCNLTSAILRPTDTRETIIRKIRLASIIGTFQSMLTDFKNISPEWKTLAELERLLGVSITGQRDCRYLQENVELLDILKLVAVDTNKEYAKRFGINQSSAVTTVKPEGTTSQMLGTSSGLHGRPAPYYIRRIRINATDPLAALLIEHGVPHHPETNQSIENCITWVFEFPQKAPEGTICKKDLSVLDQLNYWKEVKVRYTEHNPSCTIDVRSHEWITALNWVKENWEIVGGLSFLPLDERIYPLAPEEEITREEYEKRVAEMPEIDFSRLILYEKEDKTERKGNWACIGDKCEMK